MTTVTHHDHRRHHDLSHHHDAVHHSPPTTHHPPPTTLPTPTPLPAQHSVQRMHEDTDRLAEGLQNRMEGLLAGYQQLNELAVQAPLAISQFAGELTSVSRGIAEGIDGVGGTPKGADGGDGGGASTVAMEVGAWDTTETYQVLEGTHEEHLNLLRDAKDAGETTAGMNTGLNMDHLSTRRDVTHRRLAANKAKGGAFGTAGATGRAGRSGGPTGGDTDGPIHIPKFNAGGDGFGATGGTMGGTMGRTTTTSLRASGTWGRGTGLAGTGSLAGTGRSKNGSTYMQVRYVRRAAPPPDAATTPPCHHATTPPSITYPH